MDYSQHYSGSLNSSVQLHPATLLMGTHETVLELAIARLQNYFCASNGCSVCIVCRKIQEQQYECVLWLTPEKQYSLEDIQVIFSTVSFSLDPGKHFFFVIQHADALTPACANALLKSLEEPPPGYHFILLAQRAEMVLPTIKSRCIIEHHGTTSTDIPLELIAPFFITTAFQDPAVFAKELDAQNASEPESLALVDYLIIHWSNQFKKAIHENDAAQQKKSLLVIHILKKAIMQPPMPGSSKLFWKNLFLQFKNM